MIPSAVAPVSSRRAWAAVAAAWAVASGAVLAWLLGMSAGTLQEQLKVLQFWSLEISVFAGLLLAIAILPGIVRGLDRRDATRIAGVAAVAVLLTVGAAPRTNRIYYDEHIYQGAGHNLADLRRAQVCNDGTVEYGRLQCWSSGYNKQPYAYPHLLSLAYRVFGAREITAFVVNAAVMALTVCCVYLLAGLLFADRHAAFFAALIVALTPEQIIWSATAAVEPSASLACVGALLSVAHAARSQGTVPLAAAAVALAYAAQFRPESFLVVVPAAVLLSGRLRDEWTHRRLWWAGLLGFAAVAVHIGHVFAVRNAGWGTSEARLSLQYVAANLRVNGPFYLGDERFPIIVTLLAMVGFAGRRFGLERTAVALYFAVFFGIYLLFYAGSYNYGADVRYSVLTVPPLALLGGMGAARIARWLDARRLPFPGWIAVTLALAFQFLWYAPLVHAATEEAWAARADVRFARDAAAGLPPNSYVLTHNPAMFHLWGVNAGQMAIPANNPNYLEFLASRYTGGVYLHWNFWCNVQDPVHPALCGRVLAMRGGDMVREHVERDQRFAFFRMKEGLDLRPLSGR